MNKIPAYKKLYIELKNDLKQGKYAPGSFLPNETELEEQFHVSRTTIRKAIGLLSDEGYLSVKQGRGTEVQDVSTLQQLNKITSFTETLRKKGYTVSTQGFNLQQIKPTENIRDVLSLRETDTVYHLQRVQCADGKPICIMENYLTASFVPDLNLSESTLISLYSHLESHYGIILKDATERITAVPASFTKSQILQVPMNTPLLYTRRVTYIDSTPFEYALSHIVADKYEYFVHLTDRYH